MTLEEFQAKKLRREPIVMVTAYDYPTGRVADDYADAILVGDTLAMVVLGMPDTTAVSMEAMLHHAQAVRRGLSKALLIGDMPLAALNGGAAHALACAQRFTREAGCDAVKVEWREDVLAITAALREAGIPVMGHVGLTPQSAAAEGGFGMRGKDADAAARIFEQAKAMEQAGCFSIVLECVPEELARAISQALRVPAIGIGSGPLCDGQVGVFHDLVGLYEKFTPRFIKRYAALAAGMRGALESYAADVRAGRFPGPEHTVKMKPEEWEALRRRLGGGDAPGG